MALTSSGAALAQLPASITIASQPMAAALQSVARQTGVDILFAPAALQGLRSHPVRAAASAREAVETIISGSDLEVVPATHGALIVRVRQKAADPIPKPASQFIEPPPDNAANQLDTVQVQDVVVTANKRAQLLSDVPEAVTSISGAELRRTQARRFEDYLTKVPGLNFVSSGEGTTQLFIRGVTAGAAQLSSTVAVYVDDTPYGSSTVYAGGATGVPDLDPSDIDHIEVLKGPQGTLYGADALGGVLKFVTTQPNMQAFSGHMEGGGATVEGGGNGYNASGAANLPLIAGELAVRLSGFYRQDPGFIDDPGRGLTDINRSLVYGGRFALGWTPAGWAKVSLTALLQNTRARNPSAEDVTVPNLAPLKSDREQTRLFDSPKDYAYRLYSAQVDLDLAYAALISVTSYSTFGLRRVDELLTYENEFGVPFRVHQPVDENKLTQEIRLQSAAGAPFEWRVGAFFSHEHSQQRQYINSLIPITLQPTGSTLADVAAPDRYTEIAGFGDFTYQVNDRFDVTVGGRYSHNNQHLEESGTLQGMTFSAVRSTSDNSATWLFNPRYKLSAEWMLYARAASAYRPGGPTTVIPIVIVPEATYDPDHLIDYEMGVKGSWWDRRLRVEADLFYIDWRKIQLNESVSGLSYIANGGKARSRGFEASLSYNPLSGLVLTANAAHTDAALSQDALGVGGRDGDPLAAVPKWTVSFDASYEWRLNRDWSALVGGSFRYVGNRLSDFAVEADTLLPADRYTLGSYRVGDVRSGVARDNWRVTLYVKNVSDDRGVLLIAPETAFANGNPYVASIIQPRTFGLDLSMQF
ncbi:MAG: TonB-dependent receptor [Proteobacteria bacterium]|nr:TonB-dependent receptor [Pseudomonadota bacterium]